MSANLPQLCCRLTCLHLGQFRVERTGQSYLLRIDGGTLRGNACQHLLMAEGRNLVGRIPDEPFLRLCYHIAHLVGRLVLLTGILTEVTHTIGNQLATFQGVQPSVRKQVGYVHAVQLSYALRLTHLLVERIHPPGDILCHQRLLICLEFKLSFLPTDATSSQHGAHHCYHDFLLHIFCF